MIRLALDPSPDEARSWLRRELLRPEYHERDLLGRFVRWVMRSFDQALDAAGRAPALGWVAAMLVALVLVVASGWLLSRVRTSGQTRRRTGAVHDVERVSADELRRRAREALASGDASRGLVEAYRALAVRQVERGWLEDLPGATAHEVATALAASFPRQAARIDEAAQLFDAVHYGDRPTTRERAEAVLALDEELDRTEGSVPA